MHPLKVIPPRNDDEYFERMSRALFVAGLNWSIIENKWKGFQKSFSNFSVDEVSKFSEKRIQALMKDDGIVKNEKKIRAVVYNAKEIQGISKTHGSFRDYLKSFKGKQELIKDLKSRFKFLGESTTRMFLYMAGEKLTPTEDELKLHEKQSKK